ncbi:GTPase [Streptomyces sp. NPDC091281]|uniref:GTPase n=1 Tax=Streptomyces sp. NPDC091281 TaxID=3365985 RepID=UPI00381C1703
MGTAPDGPGADGRAGGAAPRPPRRRPKPPGPASAELAGLCAATAAEPGLRGTPAAEELRRFAALCGQPLRVAVVGDVSAGKSTLVNALLATRMALVQLAEATAQVTWYHHPLVGPTVAATDAAVAVPYPLFPLSDRIVLGDTPGMNTASDRQLVTEDMLRGARAASASATAVLYLCGTNLSEAAARTCTEFALSTAGPLTEGLNVVLVASKADGVDGGADTWNAVEENLLRQARLPGAASVAVAQQLAETARCGMLTRDHLGTLRAIAADEELTAVAGHGWDALGRAWAARGHPADALPPLKEVAATTYAIARSLPPLRAGEVADSDGLARLWEDLSGLRRLEERLSLLARHADVLTVDSVTARLLRATASWDTGPARLVRERLAALRTRPACAGLERSAADLALDGLTLRHVPPGDRALAARALRALPMKDRELLATARTWAAHARRPRRLLARRVAEIVVECCLTRLDSRNRDQGRDG